MNTVRPVSFTSIKQWEEAGASLMSSLQDYMNSCLGLAYNSPGDTVNPSEFAARIDSALEMVSNQLIKTGSTLAWTRNRLVPLIHRLPEEILSKIFINAVFDPIFSELSVPSSIQQQTRLIYRRLYTLITVCSSWRDMIIAEGVFWSVIPMVPSSSDANQDFVELSLERAGQSRLHLVAAQKSLDTSKDLMDALTQCCPRLRSINFSLLDHEVIVDAVNTLIEGSTESLTELSIGCTRLGASSSWTPREEDYVVPLNYPHQAKFSTLIGALTTFRTCGAHFYWQTLSFSTQLVELYIESITLGFDHEIYPFLRALSSASGLRDLKLIQLDTFYEPETPSMQPLSPIVLPNLQSLYVENSFFNTLKLLLPMIAPGSHRLTLFLNAASSENNLFDPDLETVEAEVAHVNIIELFRLLEKVPVDTLMLDGRWEQWPRGHNLPGLLMALPTLKTLKLHNWELDEGIWDNLVRPQSDRTKHQRRSFPALESLQLTSATILTDDGFDKMVTSYPLRQIVFGGTHSAGSEDESQGSSSEVIDTMVNWLRNNVPDFCLVDDKYIPLEFHPDRREWRMW